MSKANMLLATLALGVTVTLAGPAFAEKLKAVLDAKSEVPPNASAGTGIADIDFDPAIQLLPRPRSATSCAGHRGRQSAEFEVTAQRRSRFAETKSRADAGAGLGTSGGSL